MNQDFLVIAITKPDFYPGEASRISDLLEENQVDLVHIRKPGAEEAEIEKLIIEIPSKWHSRLKLHDGFNLIDKYDLGGLHLNSRNNYLHHKAKSKSISIHSAEEIDKTEGFDYFFISPVYDSISKKGYKSNFSLEQLSPIIKGRRAIALGGVVPEKYGELKAAGFSGAALSGYFFP